MKMHRVVRVFGAFPLVLWSISCGGSSEAPRCPSYVVMPDGGVTGFTELGEWRTDEVCAKYCQSDYRVCQLQAEGEVKCQQACG